VASSSAMALETAESEAFNLLQKDVAFAGLNAGGIWRGVAFPDASAYTEISAESARGVGNALCGNPIAWLVRVVVTCWSRESLPASAGDSAVALLSAQGWNEEESDVPAPYVNAGGDVYRAISVTLSKEY